MSPLQTLALLAVLGMSSGCSSLRGSIEQRMKISEQCRLATSVLPQEFQIPDTVASIQLGNVGYCSLERKQTLLPMCSINQIASKYNLLAAPTGTRDAQAASKARFVTLQAAVNTLHDEFDALATAVSAVDMTIRKARPAPGSAGTYHANTEWLVAVQQSAQSVQTHLWAVRAAQTEVMRAAEALGTQLEANAQIELAAWDMNLRIHLTRFEEVLSGNYALMVNEGVKDLVLTHVARRMLDMLHNSLKTADAVIRQLDEEAYGAVSLGYLAFGPNLQHAVSEAFESIKATYAAREHQKNLALQTAPGGARDEEKQTGKDKVSEVFANQFMLRELRRAACDNLVQGTQFSMLSELVNTMIILHVEKKDPIVSQVNPSPRKPPPVFPEDRTPLIGSAATPVELPPFTVEASALHLSAAALPTSGGGSPPPAVTPAGVHMANTWAARQQLLTQAIAAKWQARPANAERRAQSAPGIDLVDEDAVRALADVATATVVDDAVRLSPGLVDMRGAAASGYISSNVAVVTAAAAVSHAAATMNVNLSVSNVNNFTPTNYNNVTPVIHLSVPGAAATSPSLCSDAGLARAGAHCTRDGDGYVITFAQRSFRSDSCLASEMEPALTALGRGLAAYRASHGRDHLATVEGYASLPPATLARCKAAAAPPEQACSYRNKLRANKDVGGCPDTADRNVRLSAARAKNAAGVLEQAAQGALVVDALVAKGTTTAQPGPAAAPRDQTIVVRLRPAN